MVTFHRLWERDLHQATHTDTVVFAPSLFVQERLTRIARLNPETGDQMWEARVYKPWGWLEASETKIFYLSGGLQCFDQHRGNLLWEAADVGADIVSAGDRVVVGGWRGYSHVQCLDARSGEKLWALPELEDIAKPIVGPWGLALPRIEPRPSNVSDLSIVDLLTGERQNSVRLPEGTMAYDRGSSIQRYGDELLITTEPGHVYLLNPTVDDQPKLLGIHAAGIASITPTILGTIMIFQDGQRAICAYDLPASKVLWATSIETHLDWRIWRIPATRLESGDLVIGSSEGRLYVCDAHGQKIGAHTIAKRIRTDIYNLGGDRIVCGTKGTIVCYRIV